MADGEPVAKVILLCFVPQPATLRAIGGGWRAAFQNSLDVQGGPFTWISRRSLPQVEC
jgi:hypothetical protein